MFKLTVILIIGCVMTVSRGGVDAACPARTTAAPTAAPTEEPIELVTRPGITAARPLEYTTEYSGTVCSGGRILYEGFCYGAVTFAQEVSIDNVYDDLRPCLTSEYPTLLMSFLPPQYAIGSNSRANPGVLAAMRAAGVSAVPLDNRLASYGSVINWVDLYNNFPTPRWCNEQAASQTQLRCLQARELDNYNDLCMEPVDCAELKFSAILCPTIAAQPVPNFANLPAGMMVVTKKKKPKKV